MSNINCTVDNCSHNEAGACCSSNVTIGGRLANSSCSTCCGTFLNERAYGSLGNCVSSCNCTNAITCEVSNCTHNENTHCNLSSINVSTQSKEANIYSETYCDSFEEK